MYVKVLINATNFVWRALLINGVMLAEKYSWATHPADPSICVIDVKPYQILHFHGSEAIHNQADWPFGRHVCDQVSPALTHTQSLSLSSPPSLWLHWLCGSPALIPPNRWFSFYHGWFDFIQTIASFSLGFMPLMWGIAGHVLRTYFDSLDSRLGAKWHEVAHTVVFLLLIMAFGMVIELPWSLISTFHIEQKHGFNKQTLGLFVSDMVKQV